MNRGQLYENDVADFFESNDVPIDTDDKSADLCMITPSNEKINIELKQTYTADFGQSGIKWKDGTWVFSNPSKHSKFFDSIYLLDFINREWNKVPRKYTIPSKKLTFDDKEYDRLHFKTITFTIPIDYIEKYYSDCDYLQIRDCGMYHIKGDVCNYGCAKLGGYANIRIRLKTTTSKRPTGYMFVMALKLNKKPPKSPFDIFKNIEAIKRDRVISKKQFMMFTQCPKMLEFYKNSSYYDITDDMKITMQNGSKFEDIVRNAMFPGGTKVATAADVTLDMSQMFNYYRKHKRIDAFFELPFLYKNLYCRPDIIHFTSDTAIDLYELKSKTTLTSTHILDIAFQYYVVKNLGYNIDHAYLGHINKEYRRTTENIDINEFCVFDDVKEECESLYDSIESTINEMAMPHENCSMGRHCVSPYKCMYYHICCGGKLERNHILNLKGGGKANKYDLYNEGYTYINDVPLEKINIGRREQIVAERDKSTIIKYNELNDNIEPLKTGMFSILDFETNMESIPSFSNTIPYQQIPIQYSLHVLNGFDSIKHYSFLGDEYVDYRYQIAKKLCDEIPDDVPVVVWNKSFEYRVLKDMLQFEDLSHKITNIMDNLFDIMIAFRYKYYYNYKMGGSYSLKYVLPAVSDMSYDKMVVNNGMSAMYYYRMLCDPKIDPKYQHYIKKRMLEYCGLDTRSNIVIIKFLLNILKECDHASTKTE